MTSPFLRSLWGKTLWEQRRALLGWGLAMLLLPLLMASVWPTIEGQAAQLQQLLDSYPPAIKALMNLEDFTSPAGFLEAELLSLTVPLILLVYAIGRGADLIAGEEERGGLDVLVAHPIPRRRIVLEKAAALSTALAGLGALLLIGLLVGNAAAGLGVGALRLVGAALLLVLFALGFGMLAFAAGAVRGRKGAAVAVAAGAAVLSFLLSTVANLVPSIEALRWASPVTYLQTSPLTDGVDLVAMLVLAMIPLALLAVALWAFERRDVGV